MLQSCFIICLYDSSCSPGSKQWWPFTAVCHHTALCQHWWGLRLHPLSVLEWTCFECVSVSHHGSLAGCVRTERNNTTLIITIIIKSLSIASSVVTFTHVPSNTFSRFVRACVCVHACVFVCVCVLPGSLPGSLRSVSTGIDAGSYLAAYSTERRWERLDPSLHSHGTWRSTLEINV